LPIFKFHDILAYGIFYHIREEPYSMPEGSVTFGRYGK